ncbi:unnamed protein product [Lactuca saligna]|uniref:Uncharacterized protein n=1 Tax=Lactuca saligna TaxID=75948 RepID=A0AA35Z9F5_LACSI|nr:unnamed protein product [Lactuca saligna]
MAKKPEPDGKTRSPKISGRGGSRLSGNGSGIGSLLGIYFGFGAGSAFQPTSPQKIRSQSRIVASSLISFSCLVVYALSQYHPSHLHPLIVVSFGDTEIAESKLKAQSTSVQHNLNLGNMNSKSQNHAPTSENHDPTASSQDVGGSGSNQQNTNYVDQQDGTNINDTFFDEDGDEVVGSKRATLSPAWFHFIKFKLNGVVKEKCVCDGSVPGSSSFGSSMSSSHRVGFKKLLSDIASITRDDDESGETKAYCRSVEFDYDVEEENTKESGTTSLDDFV